MRRSGARWRHRGPGICSLSISEEIFDRVLSRRRFPTCFTREPVCGIGDRQIDQLDTPWGFRRRVLRLKTILAGTNVSLRFPRAAMAASRVSDLSISRSCWRKRLFAFQHFQQPHSAQAALRLQATSELSSSCVAFVGLKISEPLRCERRNSCSRFAHLRGALTRPDAYERWLICLSPDATTRNRKSVVITD